jgi:hypothetical protein
MYGTRGLWSKEMRLFPTKQKSARHRLTRRRLADSGIVFEDPDGREWNVCAYRRSSVGAWWSQEDWDRSRKLVVVFELQGVERVALVDVDRDWKSPDNLGLIFASAVERRSGGDRRSDGKSVALDRRGEPDRRTPQGRHHTG